MPDLPEGIDPSGLVDDEALRFMRQKLALPTRRWTDILRRQHDKAFVVAGATKMDLLADMKSAVETAIEEGQTLEQFRDAFDDITARHGWDFRGSRGWRSRVIYETNMRTAHAAGRYGQMTDPDVLADRPYWQYQHGGARQPRENHLSWDGLVLDATDPWWDVHYPPSGWGCSCYTISLSEDDLDRLGLEVGEAPASETYEWTDPNTGEVTELPVGVDAGWDYAPGKSWVRSQTPQFVDDWPTDVATIPDSQVARGPGLPSSREVPGSVLMDDDLPANEYVQAFLREFGAKADDETFYEDAAGETIIVSDELFRSASGEYKVKKRGRQRVIRLLARTLADPDEIWVRLEPFRREPGEWLLSRYYVARWRVEGEEAPAVSILQWTQEGWHGVTTFDPDSDVQLQKRRAGIRLYRRGE